MRKQSKLTILMIIALFAAITINAQTNWEIQNSGVSTDLNSVDFITENEGIAVGKSGVILKTTDGGLNWNINDIGIYLTFNDIQYIDENRVIIGGAEGIILYSYDGGDTWEVKQESGENYDILGIHVDPVSGKGIAGGSGFALLFSEDFGETWTHISGGNALTDYKSAYMSDENFGTVIGRNAVYQSKAEYTLDGGETWDYHVYFPFHDSTLYYGTAWDCHFFDQNHGFTVGVWDDGTMYNGFITTKVNWNSNQWDAHIFTGKPFYGLDFSDESFGVAVGGDYYTTTCIFETTDGGETWEEASIQGDGNVMLEVAVVENTGYAVGLNGEILKRVPTTTHNVGVLNIIAPQSGAGLGMEDVVVNVRNYGQVAESNFELHYTVNGGEMVTEIFNQTIPAGESMEFTFATQVDLSAYGEYTIEACTDLSGDENPDNDCSSAIIENQQSSLFPFEDGFTEGFEAGQWTFDPSQGNWQINGSHGQPAPSAEFFWDPGLTDYEFSLTSPSMLVPADAENVILKYDLYLSPYATSGNEHMTVEIFNGDEWIEVADYANFEYLPWQTYEHDLSGIAIGNTVQLRFRAWGNDTWDINEWRVDNVKFYEQVFVDFYGHVSDLANGNAIEGAEIVVGNMDPVTTDANGYFEVNFEAGIYDVMLQKEGYNTILLEDVEIMSDYEWNPELTVPTMDVETQPIEFTLAPGETASTAINIVNNGNGPLNWAAHLEVNEKSQKNNIAHSLLGNSNATQNTENPKEAWNILYNFEAQAPSQAGIETNEEHIFTSDSRISEVVFSKYEMDGTFIKTFDIAGISSVYDMAYDGTYFYGGHLTNELYVMDLENETLVNTVEVNCTGLSGIRNIAYDPTLDNGNGGFWVGGWMELGAIDMEGNELIPSITLIGGLHGSAYDPWTPGGPYLWLFSDVNQVAAFHQFDIATQSLTGVTHLCSDIPGYADGTAGGAATYNDGGRFILLASIQQNPSIVAGYELASTITWMDFNPSSGLLEAGNNQEVLLNFDATGLEVGDTKTVQLVFEPDPNVGNVAIDITLNISETQTQAIELTEGYGFVSSCILPNNPDMLVVLEDVLGDNLDYVRNQNGQQLSKIGPEWVNNIGDWNTTEGYLFKMNGAETLTIEGEVMDPATPINIASGYSFIAYLPAAAMNAMDAFETIMNDDLDYIRNSQGNQLKKIGPNWVNGIGDVHPGQGYLVKTMAAQELVYPSAKKSAPATANPETSFFAFEGGNPAEAVYTLYIDGNLEAGDEVAAFNGDKMVGATVITGEKFQNDLPIFSELVSGKGYEAGNNVILKVYDRSENTVSTVNYNMVSEYNARTATTFPAGDGEFGIVELEKAAGIADLASSINVYPNPANSVVTIEAPEAINSLRVYNYTGQVVMEKGTTDVNVEINVENFDSGMYVVEIETASGIVTKKISVQ